MGKQLRSQCFKIVNKNGDLILFSTDDVSVNKLTFTITNLTGEALSLAGGEPVKGKPAAGGSSFNFSFGPMLTGDVVKNLKLSLPAGWKAVFFPADDKKPASWSVAPETDLLIAENKEVAKIEIENIKCSGTKPGNVEIMHLNIPGYDASTFAVTRHFSVLNPPDDRKKNLPLQYGYINPVHPIQGQKWYSKEFDPNQKHEGTESQPPPIYITYDRTALIENGFTLILTNTSDAPLVPADNTGKEANPSAVYISFLLGEEDYHITTQQLADNNISIDVKAKTPWQLGTHTGGTAYWQFTPKTMGKDETVYFQVNKIITPLNVSPDAISIMYIQVNNIPGYNDAAYTMLLQKKKAKAEIKSLVADKESIRIGDDLTLSWESFLAKQVIISYETRDGETITLDSVKGQIKLNDSNFRLPVAPSAQPSVIKATPYDNSKEDAKERTITVLQKPAAIRSFSANKTLVDISAATVDLALSWEVTNAKNLVLTTPTGEINVTGTTGYVYKGLRAPFRFTLKARSYYQESPEYVSAICTVCTYRSENAIPLQKGTGGRMQPLPSILFNKQRGRVYIVNSAENTVCDIDINKLSVENKYPGNVIMLSPKGEKLFVFNPESGRKTFGTTMYDTTSGAKSSVAAYQSQVEGPYPGIAMLVSPDLTKFYAGVGFNPGSYKGGNVFAYDVDASRNSMRLSHSRTGLIARISCMAFDHNVEKIYFGTDILLNIIKLSDSGQHQSLRLPTSGPIMFAANKTDSKLYLACEGGNVITVIDTKTDSIPCTIPLKNKAVNLLISPDDKYLFAAIYNSNEIAVIDTQTNAIISTIITGQFPYGMAIDSAGELLFIANYGSKTLSVYDLKYKQLLSPQLSTGTDKGNPVDVGIHEETDGTIKVFVAKELYTDRITKGGTPIENIGLDVSVFSIRKPK